MNACGLEETFQLTKHVLIHEAAGPVHGQFQVDRRLLEASQEQPCVGHIKIHPGSVPNGFQPLLQFRLGPGGLDEGGPPVSLGARNQKHLSQGLEKVRKLASHHLNPLAWPAKTKTYRST